VDCQLSEIYAEEMLYNQEIVTAILPEDKPDI
jgi:hypothetical protein